MNSATFTKRPAARRLGTDMRRLKGGAFRRKPSDTCAFKRLAGIDEKITGRL
jgi:hypothetical protein